MSWGDPFDKFYKDDADVRREGLVDRGYVPGELVTFGNLDGDPRTKPIYFWTFPDLKASGFDVDPGMGCIIAVDCESDPTTDWLMLLINAPGKSGYGWLPVSFAKRVGINEDDD